MFRNKSFRWLIVVGVLLTTSLFFSLSPSAPASNAAFEVKVIVIDPGHGGKDPGCHGKKHLEKDVALSVALKLGKYIEENLKDVKVVYTRKTDVFVELQERAAIANRAKADLFISIHCNSACVRDKKTKKDVCKDHVNGAETYIMAIKNEEGNVNVAARENSVLTLEDDYVEKVKNFDPDSDEAIIIQSMFNSKYLEQSLGFAMKIQKQYSQRIGRTDRGVKRASLWVLWRTYMPSVLTEIGYLTNPSEEFFLGSDKGQDYIASGLFRAFREYKDELEGISKKYNDDFEKQGTFKLSKEDSLAIAGIDNVSKEEGAKDIKEPVNKTAETKTSLEKDSFNIVKEPTAIKEPVNKATEIKIPSQKDSIKTVKETPKTATETTAIVYKVQILISNQKLSLTDSKFKDAKDIWEYTESGIHKYTAGKFTDVKQAIEYKNILREKGFKDAFVIATQNGKRIPLR